ncbi:MAG TPA: beta-glucosidase [Caldilineae bacterium]|nr:beta-glucosidase [Caldilineae bacterium]
MTTEPLYKEPGQPIEKRVDDLLKRMTLEEKVAQLGSYWSYSLIGPDGLDVNKMQRLIGKGIGQITRVGGALNVTPEKSAQLTNEIQRFLVEETRLGIPAIIHEECLSGYMAYGATAFPQIIGVAATWDPDLVERMATVIREQMLAVGARQGLAPVLDVARDPRWGRTEETYGESPYLVARMGSAYVKGLQGDDLRRGVIATGKHFLGYSASEGGMNWAPTHIPQRELYEVFARPFEAAIRTAGLASIMNAYSELDGVPCGVSKEVLTDLLRGRLGFQGFVVSDYMTISTAFSYHHIAKDLQDAAVQALKAGLDLELPAVEGYGELLLDAVRKGLVSEAELDQAVRRVLEAKFRLGLFENPYADPGRIPEVYGRSEHRALAREIAVKSLVLLKNEGQLLPLRKDLKSIAIIGPNANSVRNLFGDYSYTVHIEALLEILRTGALEVPGSDEDTRRVLEEMFKKLVTAESAEAFAREAYGAKSILEAIRETVSEDTEVLYAKGCEITDTSTGGFAEAVEAARKADVAIMVLGGRSGLDVKSTSGEARDRADLGLPGVQQQLLEAVYETGTPVVLVLVDGRPLAIKWAAEHIPAILHAWVPGEEGGPAVASVLFGDASPGGRLPISVPRSVGQVPVYHYHKPSGGRSHWLGDYVEESTKPLFPFGFGLSYTKFEYSHLRLSSPQVDSRGSIEISVDVENVGQARGDEVVQLYLHDREADVTRPVRELAGFKRITLDPGQLCTVTFTVHMSQLAYYNREMKFVVEPGYVDVMVGSSAEDIRLRGEFEITGDVVEVGGDRAFFSEARVEVG